MNSSSVNRAFNFSKSAAPGFSSSTERSSVTPVSIVASRRDRPGLFLEGGNLFPNPGRRDVGQVLQQLIQGTMGLDQFHRGLLPDARNTGDIITAVPRQAQHVGDMIRGGAEAFLDGLQVKDLVLQGVPHPDLFGNKLHQVLIAGNDDHLKPFFFRLQGQGADQVIGLQPLLLQNGKAVTPADLLDIGNLDLEGLRHGGTVGLVFREDLVAEGGPFGIKDQGQVLGLLLLQDLVHHLDEPVNGLGGHPLAVGQVGNGVKGPVDIGTAVDQVEHFPWSMDIP